LILQEFLLPYEVATRAGFFFYFYCYYGFGAGELALRLDITC